MHSEHVAGVVIGAAGGMQGDIAPVGLVGPVDHIVLPVNRQIEPQDVQRTVKKVPLTVRGEGEVAIASGGGEDVTASARLVHEVGQKLTDKLTIL